LRNGVPNKNTVACLESSILAPKKFGLTMPLCKRTADVLQNDVQHFPADYIKCVSQINKAEVQWPALFMSILHFVQWKDHVSSRSLLYFWLRYCTFALCRFHWRIDLADERQNATGVNVIPHILVVVPNKLLCLQSV